jgi:phage-related tail fiber protein
MLTIDPVNTNQIIAEQVIPEDVGGWWIREIGLFDKDGDMIAVANCAETYKPQLQEGSGRVQVIRVILIVSSTEAVTLKIDPSVVLATRKYVDDAVIEVKAYVDQQLAAHVAAADPHTQYLLNRILIDFSRQVSHFRGRRQRRLRANAMARRSIRQNIRNWRGYPSGSLPDLRGVFIRGWDDGRGLTVARYSVVCR